MKYSFDIFDKNPERLATILAENCRRRRLDKGLSRRILSEMTGVPEPILERFETKGKITLCRISCKGCGRLHRSRGKNLFFTLLSAW